MGAILANNIILWIFGWDAMLLIKKILFPFLKNRLNASFIGCTTTGNVDRHRGEEQIEENIVNYNMTGCGLLLSTAFSMPFDKFFHGSCYIQRDPPPILVN